MTVKTYDEKCHDLADHFLQDEPHLFTMDHCHRLACAIQATIEDYISDAMPVPKDRPITTYLCPQCKRTSVADRNGTGDPVCVHCH